MPVKKAPDKKQSHTMQNINHDSDRNGHRLAMTDVNLEDIEYETALPDGNGTLTCLL